MSSRKRKVTKRPATSRAKQRAVAKKSSLGAAAAASKLLDSLVERAKVVRENAHAPYSKYKVGAAIATKSGKVFEGCNVENASFGATICAERGAIMQMIAAGERDPIACAVVTADGGSPCGVCRQVLSEFARDMPIVLANLSDESGKVVQLADLLPLAFDGSSLRS